MDRAASNTTTDFAAGEEYCVKAEGSEQKNAAMFTELAALVAAGDLDVPIAATFPLADVRARSPNMNKGTPGENRTAAVSSQVAIVQELQLCVEALSGKFGHSDAQPDMMDVSSIKPWPFNVFGRKSLP